MKPASIMTRLAKLCAAAGFLLSIAACASSPPPNTDVSSPYLHYVVERDVVVRRTANAGADQVGRLAAGTILKAEVVDIGDGWFRVHSDSGRTGYIFGRPLRPAE
ncbi:MAG TPA: SH3 domain-containing protein [Methylomirabilota bacterium]|nr:SH3 domain-containing protein [Methylomirabilota bacterium]